MKIKIAERLRPFSHEPGTVCLLPGSHLRLQIFPALIRVFEDELLTEIKLDIQGPLENFTVMLDLEKGGIRVFGKGLDYLLRAVQGALFAIESKKELTLSCTGGFQAFSKGKMILIAKQETAAPFLPWEKRARLSLGCHKAQDFALIKRRLDLKEVLPHWHRLGFGLPHASPPKGGTMALLERFKTCEKMETYSLLQNLFQAGFEGILFPRLTDEAHQGFALPPAGSGSPLALLAEGARLIQELFISQEGSSFHLLPRLHPEFHAGRFIDLEFTGLGKIHFEWSKKLLKKLIFQADASQTVSFRFQKAIKSCRLRTHFGDRGLKTLCPISLSVQAGTTYYFDCFEK